MTFAAALRPALRHPLRTPFGNPIGGGKAFTPADIFLGGDKGAFYDFTDMSSLSQDTGGATPVTAGGQPIGRALDKSGKGNHATQAGTKGTFNAVTGLQCLGTGTIITPALFDTSFNNAGTFFIVLKPVNAQTDLRVFQGRDTGIYQGFDGSNGNWYNTNGYSNLAMGVGLDTEGLCISEFGAGFGTLTLNRWWMQQSGDPRSATAFTTARTGQTGGMGFGAADAWMLGGIPAGFIYPGAIAGFFCINRILTLADQVKVAKWFATRFNLYPKKLLVTAGDSLTAGQGSTGGVSQNQSPAGNNYPARVWNNLQATWDVRIDAYGGRTLANMIAEAPGVASKAISQGRKVVAVWAGTNTLAATQSVATTLSQLAAYCAARKAEGSNVLVGTMLNRGDSYGGFNADRLAVNADIAANFASYSDGIIDFAAQPELSTISNLTYFNADQVHLTDAGYQIAANTEIAKITAMGW